MITSAYFFCINSANFTEVRRASLVACVKSGSKIGIYDLLLEIL